MVRRPDVGRITDQVTYPEWWSAVQMWVGSRTRSPTRSGGSPSRCGWDHGPGHLPGVVVRRPDVGRITDQVTYPEWWSAVQMWVGSRTRSPTRSGGPPSRCGWDHGPGHLPGVVVRRPDVGRITDQVTYPEWWFAVQMWVGSRTRSPTRSGGRPRPAAVVRRVGRRVARISVCAGVKDILRFRRTV